jgi:type IX secretion system substrate protein
LNHTVFQTIVIPTLNPPTHGYGVNIYYISEALFDTNPSNIEYFLSYFDNNSIWHCKVFDQSGNTLFSKDSVSYEDSQYDVYNFITYTSSGVKMILYNGISGGASVYSLPGTLPCNDCTGGQVTALKTNGNTPNVGISNYPNPASNQTTVQYSLPQGITAADLVFYSIQGVEVKRFQVTNAFTDILISTSDLESGTYYYQIQAANGYSAGKKMIVIK